MIRRRAREMDTDELREILLEDIIWPDETDITEDQIRDMALSLMVHGQIQPIVVTGPDEDGKYRGVVGRLRYEGMKERWKDEPEGKTILARVRRFRDELELRMWQLAENLHRRQLPAMQKARQLKALYDLIRKERGEKATVQTLAEAIEDMTGEKESMKTVQHYLSLTRLEPEVQEILTREKWPLRWGLELLRIKTPKSQVEAARKIQKRTDLFSSSEDVKWHVGEVLAEERRKRRDEQLKKKAERLRRETGKKVYVDRLLSWKDREKFHDWWGEPPEECKGCDRTGILLEANFHERLICLNPECWNKKLEEKRELEEREERAREKRQAAECRRIWDVEEYDERHYRLVVLGLIDQMDLADILGMDRWRPEDIEKAVENASTLNTRECIDILVKKAAEKVLLEPWWGAYSAQGKIKKWVIETFNLNQETWVEA